MIVTIKHDKDVKKVTKGAYENFYKNMGYEIVNEKKPKEVKEAVISEKPEVVKKEKLNEEK